MPMKRTDVERSKWTAKNGTVHECISVRRNGYTALSFEFDQLDEAEQAARDLLRLAAEWRAEVSAREAPGAKAGDGVIWA